MPDRIYQGPYAETELHLPTAIVKVAKGETVKDLPDEVVQGLDEQGDWAKPGAKPKPETKE